MLCSCFHSRYDSSLWSFSISNLRTLCPWMWKQYNNTIQTLLSISFFACIPSLILFFCIFFMIAAFLSILMTRYLFSIKVYHVVPITGKTDKVFELELFVCYSWIVFLVNRHNSGIHDATRFLENTLEFMRDVSFRYLRIILSILWSNFMISSPE